MANNQTDQTNQSVKDPQQNIQASETVQSPKNRRPARAAAIVAVVCALVAWVSFFMSDVWALTFSTIGLLCSVAGLWSGKGCVRDLAITALIATAILLIVYGLFYWGLEYVATLV